MRVYTVPGKSHQADYALEVASKCIDWYSDWFGIRMPLPKCDLLAVPDFSMGISFQYSREINNFKKSFFLVRRHGELGPDHLPRAISAGGSD